MAYHKLNISPIIDLLVRASLKVHIQFRNPVLPFMGLPRITEYLLPPKFLRLCLLLWAVPAPVLIRTRRHSSYIGNVPGLRESIGNNRGSTKINYSTTTPRTIALRLGLLQLAISYRFSLALALPRIALATFFFGSYFAHISSMFPFFIVTVRIKVNSGLSPVTSGTYLFTRTVILQIEAKRPQLLAGHMIPGAHLILAF